MKYLLDTCILLWALEGNSAKLSKFEQVIMDTESVIFVSIASYWEISIKQSIGRIKIESDLVKAIEDSGFKWLDIEIRHIDYIKKLPLIHNDPFDRLLISQAKVDGLNIMTTDSKILQYNI